MKRYGGTQKKACYFFSGSNPLVFHIEMAHKIKNVRERVDAISSSKDKFNLAQGPEPKNIKIHKRDMTHSFVDPSNCERPRPRPVLWDVGPNPRKWVESCYCLSKWRFD